MLLREMGACARPDGARHMVADRRYGRMSVQFRERDGALKNVARHSARYAAGSADRIAMRLCRRRCHTLAACPAAKRSCSTTRVTSGLPVWIARNFEKALDWIAESERPEGQPATGLRAK